jgi:hypothetical protein
LIGRERGRGVGGRVAREGNTSNAHSSVEYVLCRGDLR